MILFEQLVEQLMAQGKEARAFNLMKRLEVWEPSDLSPKQTVIVLWLSRTYSTFL